MAQVSAIPAEGLRRLSTEQLLVVFGGMEAPAMEEMDGEYAAELLRQPSVFAAISQARFQCRTRSCRGCARPSGR